jgi:ABC-type transporter Mla subunit MlaD
VLDKVIGSVVPLARLPLTLVEGLESVIEQATHVATRAARIADRAEPITDRIEALLDRAETVPDRIEEVLVRSADLAAAVGALLEDATATLASVKPAIDAGLVREVADLLPALRSLEQLVPVVSQLGVQVDNLDRTVADVGALLGGLPGAARLLKRGETARPAR